MNLSLDHLKFVSSFPKLRCLKLFATRFTLGPTITGVEDNWSYPPLDELQINSYHIQSEGDSMRKDFFNSLKSKKLILTDPSYGPVLET